MWSRLRRRSMAPRRPVLFESQYAVALLTAILLMAGIGFALWAVFGR